MKLYMEDSVGNRVMLGVVVWGGSGNRQPWKLSTLGSGPCDWNAEIVRAMKKMDGGRPMEDSARLGWLAFRFRGAHYEIERRDIADDYAETVERLIASRSWIDHPGPDEELPEDWMPDAYAAYWSEMADLQKVSEK